MNSASIRVWLIGSCLLALGAPPFLVQEDAAARETRERNRGAVALLSPGDRERLRRSFEDYRRLSEEERTRLAVFHDKLVENDAKLGGLSQTMDVYLHWVKTIPLYQREALLKETDSRKRLAKVREIVEQQSTRSVERTFQRQPGMPPMLGFLLQGAPVLSSDELAEVMKGIEESKFKFLSAEEQQRISDLEGIEKYLNLLRTLRERNIDVWNDPEVSLSLAQSLPESRLEDFLEWVPSRFPEVNAQSLQRARRLLCLTVSLMRELRRSQANLQTPSDEELAAVLQAAPEDEQERLLLLEASDFRTELAQMYRQQKGSLPGGEVFSLLRDVARRLRLPERGFPDRGGFRRGGFDGRPPDDDRPGGFGNRPFEGRGERPGFRRPPDDGPPPFFRGGRGPTPRESPPDQPEQASSPEGPGADNRD